MKVIEIDALISALNKKPQTKNYMMRVSDVYNVIRSIKVYDVDIEQCNENIQFVQKANRRNV